MSTHSHLPPQPRPLPAARPNGCALTDAEIGPIDANALEKIAQERPDECFLKGTGVLKLLSGIRQLEAEIRRLSAAPAATALADAEIIELARRTLDNGLCLDRTARITRSTDAEIVAFARALYAAPSAGEPR